MVDKIVYRKILSLGDPRCLFLINVQSDPGQARVPALFCGFRFLLNEYQGSLSFSPYY
jgi:hypothetical protein